VRRGELLQSAWQRWSQQTLLAREHARTVGPIQRLFVRRRQQRCLLAWRTLVRTLARHRSRLLKIGRRRREIFLSSAFHRWRGAVQAPLAACRVAMAQRSLLLRRRTLHAWHGVLQSDRLAAQRTPTQTAGSEASRAAAGFSLLAAGLPRPGPPQRAPA